MPAFLVSLPLCSRRCGATPDLVGARCRSMSTLKPALPRSESELGANRKIHGDKSYYYAHNEGWEVPANASVRSGPGLVAGGSPAKLGPDGEPEAGNNSIVSDAEDPRDDIIRNLRARIDELESELVQGRSGNKAITQFCFGDEGAKCKIYCDVGAELLGSKQATDDEGVHSEAAVVVTFFLRTVVLRVLAPRADGTVGERRAATFACESEVVPSKCSYKVDRTKGRVTLTLKKKDELKKWTKVTTQAT